MVCIPDIFANAGGVTVSYCRVGAKTVRTSSGTEDKVNEELDNVMTASHRRIRAVMDEHKISMRRAAFALAILEVKQATDLRGLQ